MYNLIFVRNKKTSTWESIGHCFPKLFYIDEVNHATHTLTSYIIIYIIHY